MNDLVQFSPETKDIREVCYLINPIFLDFTDLDGKKA